MVTKVLIAILLLSTLAVNGQGFETRSRQFFAMDVLTGGIIGGIGASFHKKEGQTRGNAFLKGFAKGCVGGSFTFTGKYMTYGLFKYERYEMAWPAKIVHSAGASMIENAARNAAIYDNWALDYGPVRVDVNYKGKIHPRIQPFALASLIATSLAGDKTKFDIKRTLQSGTPYFTYRDFSDVFTTQTNGSTIVNTIRINEAAFLILPFVGGKDPKEDNMYNTTAHELIHVFQYREYLSINNMYFNNDKKFIYFDFPAFDIAYVPYARLHRDYYNNPYENQAETLSRRKFVR